MSRRLALQLDQRRRDIDDELEALMSVLRSHNATLTSSLVDAEGFPRADIDIHAIRIARNRIAHLRNDRVAISEQMADAMRQAFLAPPGDHSAAARGDLPNGSGGAHSDAASGSSSPAPPPSFKPFARVNSVAADSPAAHAGLREGDLLLSFAGLAVPASDAAPPPSLASLPPLVREGVAIDVVVSRGGDALTLRLTPASGSTHRGLLGCHLLPV